MATKDEALKIAIEAIEYTNWSERTAKMETALEACRQALEQPAQEPVAIVTGHIEISLLSDTINKMLPINTELYTHPAPSWQKLSDDEIGVLFDSVMANDKVSTEFFGIEFARAIEAKLKEKNICTQG